MPFVHIHWYEGRSAEQKEEIAKRITDALVEVGETSPEHVWIRYEDSSPGDWSMGGKIQGEGP